LQTFVIWPWIAVNEPRSAFSAIATDVARPFGAELLFEFLDPFFEVINFAWQSVQAIPRWDLTKRR
jgi:hypothetical protein